MGFKKGFVHLLPVIIIILITGILIYVLIQKGILKKPSLFGAKKPTVELKTEYKNPLKKNTQYANPFNDFKNPFNNI